MEKIKSRECSSKVADLLLRQYNQLEIPTQAKRNIIRKIDKLVTKYRLHQKSKPTNNKRSAQSITTLNQNQLIKKSQHFESVNLFVL